MSVVLTEYDDTSLNKPDISTRVRAIQNGRLIKIQP